MVIAVCSLALAVDREREEIRAAFGSAGPVPALVTAPLGDGPSSRSDSRRRRARSTTSAGVPPTGDMRSRSDGPRAGTGIDVKVELTVNGERLEADVWAGESLLFTLREGSGCRAQERVRAGRVRLLLGLLDGTLVCACLVLTAQAEGHEIVTVEGLGRRASSTASRRPSPRPARCSAASARPAWSWRPPPCSSGARTRATTRSARRSPATSALHRLPEDLRRRPRGGGIGGGAVSTPERKLELGRVGESVRGSTRFPRSQASSPTRATSTRPTCSGATPSAARTRTRS